MPELAHLGFDPLDDQMAWTRFGDLLAARQDQAEAAAAWTSASWPGSATCTPTRSSSRPGCATTAAPTASPRRRSAACTGPWSRRCRRPSSTGARRWPTSSTGTSSATSASSSASTTSTTGRAQACPRCRGTIVRVKANGRSSFLLSPLPDLTASATGQVGPSRPGRTSPRGSPKPCPVTPLG